MSNIVVSYEKVKSHNMPEDTWADADAWFKHVVDSISNVNNYNNADKKSGVNVKRGCQTGDNLYSALASRIKNKGVYEGDYGYGKVFKDIIGEYIISIDDKTVIDQKINTMNSILNYFNNDEQLIYYDPRDEDIKPDIAETEVDISKLDLEKEVRLAVLISFNAARGKVKAGQVIGRLVNKYPELMKARAKDVGPLVGKSIGMIGNEIRALGEEGAKSILEKEFPDYEKYLDKEKSGPVRLKEPLQYYFSGGNLKPEVAYFDIGDEQYGIPLSILIKKMKHDKKAYQELNLLKPGGAKWPQSGGGKFYMVLSNDPFLNMCKSTTRYWGNSSCENYSSSGNYPQGPVSDVWFGNLIVYIFKGDRPCEGWPYKQSVGSGWQNKVDAAPVGTLLSRTNVKWGYKENKSPDNGGSIGGGIDPGHYPSNGRKGYQANSNRAVAMILAEAGLFNYTTMRTPYYYKGHCDVGSGTGNLTYSSSTSCFTRIDQMNFNPDLIVAENPNISYYDFNRLTKPATDRKVKLLLAKNHTIWAIPENDKGINRLLQTNDKDIISLMMASPIASVEAMNYVLDNLEFIEPEANDYTKITNNICKIISRHPNASEEIHTKLIKKHPDFTNGLTAKEVFYLYNHLLYPTETNVSMMPQNILSSEISNFLNRKSFDVDKLKSNIIKGSKSEVDKGYQGINPILAPYKLELKDGNDGLLIERKIDIIYSSLFVNNLIFAKYLTIKDYTKLLVKFKNSLYSWKTISEHHDKYPLISSLVSNTSKMIGDSICIPLYDVKHYGWYGGVDRFDYSFPNYASTDTFLLKKDRQSPGVINHVYLIYPEVFESGKILEYIRNKSFYDKLWREKDKYSIDPYYFTLECRSSQYHNKRSIATYWDERILDYAFENTKKPTRAFLYSFLPYDETNSIKRDRIHTRLLSTILKSDKYVNELSIPVISKWIYGDIKYFKRFEDIVLKMALKDLYDSGEFKEPHKDAFKLYDSTEDIYILGEVAAGLNGEEGGLCRNKNIPYYIQDCLINKWPQISNRYGGDMDEVMPIIELELSKNPATASDLLEKLIKNPKYAVNVARNPNTSQKLLNMLYRDYPVEVLCNPSLSQKSFNNFWKLTNNILRKEVDVNINRLNELLKRPDDKISGVKRRKQILGYLNNAQTWIGYWRGGNTKKGKFAPYASNNWYSEGIADYPIIDKIQNKKIIMLKFWDDKERHMENELWEIKSFEVSGPYHAKVVADKHTGTSTERIEGKIKINDLFSYIPKSKRKTDKKSKDDEGNEIIIKADKWTFDNIFVFTDSKVDSKTKPIPSWRYSWDNSSLKQITKAYIKRSNTEKIKSLLNAWDLPYTVKSGMVSESKYAVLSHRIIMETLDELNMWNTNLVGICLGSLLSNSANNYNSCKNIPLTKTLLEVCVSETQEDLDKFKLVGDMQTPIKMKDLESARGKILDEVNVPIKFVYFVIKNSVDKALMAKAVKIKNERLKEYSEYYTIMNPPPELIRK